MYLKFYQLKEKPFQITTNSKFLWLGEKNKTSWAMLKHGMLNSSSGVLLTGDVGTGKTMLFRSVLSMLDESVLTALVPDPGLEVVDFFNFIANEFKIRRSFSRKEAFFDYFQKFLETAHQDGKRVLLVVDEAQQLSQVLLKEICRLAAIKAHGVRLIHVCLVGQNEFKPILRAPENHALREQISVNCCLDPLSADETARYLIHRLKIAGARQRVFSREAMGEIYRYSLGNPRRINDVADLALTGGYVQKRHIITGDIVRKCVTSYQQLNLPEESVSENPVRAVLPQDPAPMTLSAAQSRSPFAPVRVMAVTAAGLAVFAVSYFFYSGQDRNVRRSADGRPVAASVSAQGKAPFVRGPSFKSVDRPGVQLKVLPGVPADPTTESLLLQVKQGILFGSSSGESLVGEVEITNDRSGQQPVATAKASPQAAIEVPGHFDGNATTASAGKSTASRLVDHMASADGGPAGKAAAVQFAETDRTSTAVRQVDSESTPIQAGPATVSQRKVGSRAMSESAIQPLPVAEPGTETTVDLTSGAGQTPNRANRHGLPDGQGVSGSRPVGDVGENVPPVNAPAHAETKPAFHAPPLPSGKAGAESSALPGSEGSSQREWLQRLSESEQKPLLESSFENKEAQVMPAPPVSAPAQSLPSAAQSSSRLKAILSHGPFFFKSTARPEGQETRTVVRETSASVSRDPSSAVKPVKNAAKQASAPDPTDVIDWLLKKKRHGK